MTPSKAARAQELKRRRPTTSSGSNLSAAILIGSAVLMLLGVMVSSLMEHERVTRYQRDEWFALPWNPDWPPMPGPLGNVREDIAAHCWRLALRSSSLSPSDSGIPECAVVGTGSPAETSISAESSRGHC